MGYVIYRRLPTYENWRRDQVMFMKYCLWYPKYWAERNEEYWEHCMRYLIKGSIDFWPPMGRFFDMGRDRVELT